MNRGKLQKDAITIEKPAQSHLSAFANIHYLLVF